MWTLHLSCATVIFDVDCCQFGPNWIMGWNRSLWSVPTCLVVQRSKAVFFLSIYDIINDMKLFQNVWTTPQPCQSHFCYLLLPIWPMLDVWAENEGYGLFRIGWRYIRAKLFVSRPYMIVPMIWNNSEVSALHLSITKAISVVDCCQFVQAWLLGWKRRLLPVPIWLVVQRIKAVFFLTSYDSINEMKKFCIVCITAQPCHSHFYCWLLPIWP